MDLSNPIRTLVPSLEGEVYRIVARTTMPLSGSRIASLAQDGSNPGIRRALARLVKHGTITASSTGSATLYTANRDHLLWPAIEALVSAADQAFRSLESRIVELATLHREPHRTQDVSIAFYGSVARGTSTLESDVDIVAVFPSPGMTEQDQALIDSLTAGVASWTGNSCNVYPLTREQLIQLVSAGDPIVGAWSEDAVTVFGEDVRHLVAAPE